MKNTEAEKTGKCKKIFIELEKLSPRDVGLSVLLMGFAFIVDSFAKNPLGMGIVIVLIGITIFMCPIFRK